MIDEYSMTAKPKRYRKPKEGDILAIPLGNGTYGFCQVAFGEDYAYFDLQRDKFLPVEEIISHPIAFRVPMMGDSAKDGEWISLGNAPLNGPLSKVSDYWSQPVGSNQLRIWRGNTFIAATADDVKGLEKMAGWYEHHIVQRLLDYFAGRANDTVEYLKKIKVYDPQTGQEIKS